MKTLTLFLATTLLVGATVELKSSHAKLIHPNTPRPSQASYGLKSIPFNAVHHGQTAAPRLKLWQSTSGNWSGYGVPLEKSGVSDTFSEASGTWNVPTVTGTGRTTTYSSCWVGIDGYSSRSVEQIGTEQDWSNGKQKNYVWFEMYPAGSYQITGFPIKPGDSISAQVLYLGQFTVQTGVGRHKGTALQDVFQLTIVNNTQGASYTVPTSYTTTSPVDRSSAEWIVEAPASGKILPLANFSPVNFSDCFATGQVNGSGSINNWPADPLTMMDPTGGGEADPSALSSDGTAFSVTHQ
jgi:hypothetical protein